METQDRTLAESIFGINYSTGTVEELSPRDTNSVRTRYRKRAPIQRQRATIPEVFVPPHAAVIRHKVSLLNRCIRSVILRAVTGFYAAETERSFDASFHVISCNKEVHRKD